MKRGYYGIGIYHPKTTENIGTLWRTAHNFGADFIFTIGKRYKKQASDTTKAERHIPLYEYETFEDLRNHLPRGCSIIFIEQAEGAKNLKDATHPETACYILGAEDYGIPEHMMHDYQKIFINTPLCLNVSVAGSIVIYDRHIKL
jgi:tRNA (guanosine-2'-O-)-methyltransferase